MLIVGCAGACSEPVDDTFEVTIGTKIQAPGLKPITVPIPESLQRGALIPALHDAASDWVDARADDAPEGELPRATLRLEPSTPLDRVGWTGINYTLGEAGIRAFTIYMDGGVPVRSVLPAPADPDDEPVLARVGSVSLTLGRDAKGAWAALGATWTEAPGADLSRSPKFRQPLTVSLANGHTCRIAPTPDAIDAHLRSFGLTSPLRILISAPPDTRPVQELALARELQSRGWGVLSAGLARPRAGLPCTNPVANGKELGQSGARFMMQLPE